MTSSKQSSSTTTSVKMKAEKRALSFSPAVRVRCTLHVLDYTSKETRATWYTVDEIKQIRKEAQETIQMTNGQQAVMTAAVQHGDQSVEDLACVWGLERYNRITKKMKSRQKRRAHAVLFTQQTIQQETNCINPERLARAYGEVCDTSSQMAEFMGEVYAEEVREENAAFNYDVQPQHQPLQQTYIEVEEEVQPELIQQQLQDRSIIEKRKTALPRKNRTMTRKDALLRRFRVSSAAA